MQKRAPSPVGDRLRAAREIVPDLTARELDRLAETTQGHASLIESGVVHRLRTDTATGLAHVLGVSLDWLINGVGDDPDPAVVAQAVASAREARANKSGEHGKPSADDLKRAASS